MRRSPHGSGGMRCALMIRSVMAEAAVVLSGTGGIWQVRTGAGEIVEASIRGKLKQEGALKLAVGDDIRIERGSDVTWTIEEILPRRSTLSRRSPQNRNK